jgi:hypothetical protein
MEIATKVVVYLHNNDDARGKLISVYMITWGLKIGGAF